MNDALLIAETLEVAFGRGARKVQALRGVSVAIARGETVGIVGESGSGKTTLGRALLRLIDATSGRIVFDGRDITALSADAMRPLRRRMQIVFQDPMASLNPRHTIRRILAEPMLFHRVAASAEEAERRIGAMFERFGLPVSCLSRYPHELSGGQRQRVGIARAALLRPDFVLADEIVSGLDVSNQAQALNLLKELSAELGLAMAFISHDLSVVRAICDRVYVLRHGLVVEEGATENVFAAPAHPYTRALIDAIPGPRIDPGWLDREIAVEGAA